MAITLAEASLLVRADMSRAKSDVVKGGQEAASKGGAAAGTAYGEKFTGSVKGFAGRASSAIGSLTSVVTGVGLAGLVGFGLKSAASLEQAQIGFQTLLGSGKKAATFLTGLQKFAAATPFTLPGLIDSSRTLLGVGVSAKQVVPLLQAFGDTAGAVGVQQDAFQRIMIATSQAISAGKFMQGDLNQIMTNGIPIWSILAKATGKPVPELRKMASAGKLLSKDVLPILQKEMEKDYGGAMARQSMTLAGVWSTLTDTVSIGLANALKPLVPMLSGFIPKAATAASAGLTAVSKTIVAVLTAFKTGAVTSTGLVGGLQMVAATVSHMISILRGGSATVGVQNPFTQLAVSVRANLPTIEHFAGVIITGVVGAFKILGPAIANVVGWMAQHTTVVKTVVGAMLALVAITKIHAAFLAVEAAGGLIQYIAKLNIVQSLTKVWTAVQWLLNAAMDANPIGIVVVALAALAAGLYLAWTHSATFRNIVIGAWNGIRAAVSAVAGWFTGVLWPMLKGVWDAIATASLWLWHTIIEPVWHVIQGIIKVASAVIQLAIAIIVAYIRTVVAPTFMWLWNNIVSPVFKGISAIVRTEIAGVRAIISGLVAFFRGVVAPVFSWLWHNIVGPAFSGIGTAISSVWNGVIKPVLTTLSNFVKVTLGAAFRIGVAAIAKAWDGLKAAAKAPVVFVVNSIINPLIGGFNKFAKIFHTPTIGTIPGFAEGGRIPGNASSTDNRVGSMVNAAGKFLGPIRVATGEFVVNARDTAKALPILNWINAGMRGGPTEVARRIGRPLTDMPGDGSEGWAFAKGGLVGFLSDIWGAVTNPVKAIKSPIESLIKKIPGGGGIRDVLAGMANKLLGGFMSFVTGGSSGGVMAPGNVGKAQQFVMAQNGKPYVWASAGPGGYDCSGIVSAVYNVMKGRSPYSHTFSTESLPGGFFHEGARSGPLLAGWSHPGEAPASSSIGHMAGMIGGLPFESSGSRGVHLGASARGVGQFAHIGSAYAKGGLARLAQVAMADSGRVTLDRGWNLIGNGTGARERLATAGAGGATEFHAHFHGPVASKNAAKDMVYGAWLDLVRDRKIPG